jgi:mono/diheme cytochrome c family protein
MRSTLCALIVAAGAGAACGSPPEVAPAASDTVVPVTAELIREGRTAYRKYCTQCHGYSGKGDGSSAAHLDPPPRDHTNAGLMDPIADRVIAETVRYGGEGRGFPNMPAFPQVTDQELTALVAYVRSLSRPDVQSVEVGDLD